MSEFGKMTNELENIKISIKRIETAVCGDENAGIEGLAKKVSRHEKLLTNDGGLELLTEKVNKHDKTINIWQRGVYIATGAGLVVGLIWKFLTK